LNEKLEIYVSPGLSGRDVLFVPAQILAGVEASYRMRKAVESLGGKKNRLAEWFGRVIRRLYDYYLKLEEKIDPVERVLKAMSTTNQFIVHTQFPDEFYRLLRRHRWKHIFWFSIDLVITAVVIVLTPFLAPIPGPNVFLYYPVLRLLSHYRAIQGASSGVRSHNIEFVIPDASRKLS
jgi:hypothetical protein